MGRKLFMRHLNEVALSPPPEISAIYSPDEGIAAFTFSYAKDNVARSCELKLLATDVDEYPDGNTYMLFTDDDTTDRTITKKLEIINAVLMGRPLTQALAEISQSLQLTLSSGRSDNPIALDESESGTQEEAEEDQPGDSDDDLADYYDDDDENFGFGAPVGADDTSTKQPGLAARARPGTSLSNKVNMQKIKTDLRAARDAGFRVGVHGDLTTGGIVCISVRVTKLGISEEAMQAWALRRSHYFVLMIRFLHGYRDLTQVREDASLSGLTEMRVVLCDRYKPHRKDALAAFGQISTVASEALLAEYKPVESLFIASPLNDLLRDRFPKIVKFREAYEYNWPSAEAFLNAAQAKAASAIEHIPVDDYVLKDDMSGKAVPDIVKADAINGNLLKNVSLPLAAMQFALRHFVCCTEFCLVCHCKVENTFEALKPYVCSSPLCLYQYMALGFGPSIEWEVLSQPYVVDLLISFCYSAAHQGRLKELPVGIDLKIPVLAKYADSYGHLRGSHLQPSPTASYEPNISAKMDYDRNELLFDPDQKSNTSSLRTGDWVALQPKDRLIETHHRIVDAMFPTYWLSSPIQIKRVLGSELNPGTTARRPGQTDSSGLADAKTSTVINDPTGMSIVACHCYESRFDSLGKAEQHQAVKTLLDTLPSVIDMQRYLQRQSFQEPSLKTWQIRISDSALNLLRWIIASNRSCIMQVDRVAEGGRAESSIASLGNDRVVGMDDWLQFRFAQGAPDKEQRFVDSVNKISADKAHPTFFAWHGSPIGNWHSIIRQGLRYDETLHGRAYGNGVYMSSLAATSMGYSNMHVGPDVWPNSTLRVSNALSLQEVVNMPDKFVSKAPHYVVANIDWIQTRYLFVKSSLKYDRINNDQKFVEYTQEGMMLATNEAGVAIKIPITAVSKSRRPAMGQTSMTNGSKKIKNTTAIDQAMAEQQEDDANSVVSDWEDLTLLSSSDNELDNDDIDEIDEISADEFYLSSTGARTPATSSRTSSKKRAQDYDNETDFRPGSLDVSNISFLPPPADATTLANKALMGAYKEALKTQTSTPPHKLGWYIDPDRIENMYQWIVELHSFNAALPLAKDMKNAGVTSIVLEMRFTNQFPFSPPFIRVVKPRFLPFNQGGGGHVTEGGAICMELLTNSGWSAVTSIESLLLQVQLAMSDEERPARLLPQKHPNGYPSTRGDSYGVGEAVAAYERACRAHGWQIPDGFRKFALSEHSGL